MSVLQTSRSSMLWLLAFIVGSLLIFLGASPYMISGEVPETVMHSVLLSEIALGVSILFLFHISTRPFLALPRYVVPVVGIFFGLVLVSVLLFRVDYSRFSLMVGFVCSALLLMLFSIYIVKARKGLVYLIPNFETANWMDQAGVKFEVLGESVLPDILPDAVCVDLHSTVSSDWQRLIADFSLLRVPVYHVASLQEMIDGKVDTRYLHENSVGSLMVDGVYEPLKRLIDVLGCLLLLPAVVPVVLFTALLIRIESQGNPFFFQSRVGEGGRIFRLWKLRSMAELSATETAKFATDETHRITRIGAVIRKCRIDELPQLWNVLKGDMSLIGPRPEQPSFVESFNQQIPFYSYRHIVKPGITGWAQVEQGYADCEDTTAEKLSYDLFYIKNYSFWLDAVIVLKTLRTILTGFGAR